MNMVIRNWLGLAGLAAIAAAFTTMAGCAGSKNEGDDATGGTAAGGSGDTGGVTSNSGGTSSSSVTANGGATSASTSTLTVPEGVTCAEPVAIPNPLITDFKEVTAGTYNGTNFEWGTSTTLTGGTFFYDGDGDDTVHVLTVAVANTEAVIGGTIGVGSFAGFGFWFGPACNNASGYTGISFTLKGDMGNTQLEVQMQSSRNYPIDTANKKGECDWGTDATTKWSVCVSNTKKFSTLAVTADAATTVQIPWAEFTGGKPVDPLNAGEILGMQWQFNCGTEAACTPSVTLDDVKFY